MSRALHPRALRADTAPVADISDIGTRRSRDAATGPHHPGVVAAYPFIACTAAALALVLLLLAVLLDR